MGIIDLSPLSELSCLLVLDLSNNQIRDISPIPRESRYSNLDLSNNLITDLSPLHKLGIDKLNISGNPYSSMELKALRKANPNIRIGSTNEQYD
jgi:Leucine-rich repeat (LRR) protein